MTIEKAEKTFKLAVSEFKAAESQEDFRQASEKAWRAAREAVYAVMEAAGELKDRRGTLSTGKVALFEDSVFSRDRSRGQPLADGYSRARDTLHGECFYDGDCPPMWELEKAFGRVASLIE